MTVLYQIVNLIISTLGGLYLWIVLLRFMMQVAQADFYNPVSQFVFKATNPVLLPIRRLVPGLFGVDVASLVLAFLVQLLIFLIPSLLAAGLNQPYLALLAASVLKVAATLIGIYFVLVLVSIISSWVAPYSHHPLLVLSRQISEPVLSPFRRLLPPLGGLDLSPILFLLTVNILVVLLAAGSQQMGIPPKMVLGLLGFLAY